MSVHLSILRRSDLERPKSIHKRARTTSTEIMDDEDNDPTLVQRQQGPTINWTELLLNHNNPKLKEHIESFTKPSASFSSADSTTLSEDEADSLQSLMEHADGFESGFDTFDDFLTFSTSNLEEQEAEQASKTGDVEPKKSKSKLKRKLKKLKTKLATSLHVKKQLKRIKKNSGAILRAVTNATALVFRGVLFLTVNILIVLTVILSLAIV